MRLRSRNGEQFPATSGCWRACETTFIVPQVPLPEVIEWRESGEVGCRSRAPCASIAHVVRVYARPRQTSGCCSRCWCSRPPICLPDCPPATGVHVRMHARACLHVGPCRAVLSDAVPYGAVRYSAVLCSAALQGCLQWCCAERCRAVRCSAELAGWCSSVLQGAVQRRAARCRARVPMSCAPVPLHIRVPAPPWLFCLRAVLARFVLGLVLVLALALVLVLAHVRVLVHAMSWYQRRALACASACAVLVLLHALVHASECWYTKPGPCTCACAGEGARACADACTGCGACCVHPAASPDSRYSSISRVVSHPTASGFIDRSHGRAVLARGQAFALSTRADGAAAAGGCADGTAQKVPVMVLAQGAGPAPGQVFPLRAVVRASGSGIGMSRSGRQCNGMCLQGSAGGEARARRAAVSGGPHY
eukprot:gene17562-biopygen17339